MIIFDQFRLSQVLLFILFCIFNFLLLLVLLYSLFLFIFTCFFLSWFLCLRLVQTLAILLILLLLFLLFSIHCPVQYLHSVFEGEILLIILLGLFKKPFDHVNVIGIFIQLHFEFVFALVEHVLDEVCQFLNGYCRLFVFGVDFLPSFQYVFVTDLKNGLVFLFFLLGH